MRNLFRYLLAFGMIAIGARHFTDPEPFVRIVPRVLPAPLALVYVSGLGEILGGVGLLVPATRRAAAWGLIALYVAVFPANINMAVNHLAMGAHPLPAWLPWARLPLQAALIAWAWQYTRRTP